MAFDSKALTLIFISLLLGLNVGYSEGEPSLAEQKEKSLELRYRYLLGLSSRGSLQDKQDYAPLIEKAKLNWNNQRIAMGYPIHDYSGKDNPKQLPVNELDEQPLNIVPVNHYVSKGHLTAISKASDWSAAKLRALANSVQLKPSTPYILSSSRKVSLKTPKIFSSWRFWKYQAHNDTWLALKSGHHRQTIELVCSVDEIETFTFTDALKHPSKIDDLIKYQVEIDLLKPTFESAHWAENEKGDFVISWSFSDKNLSSEQMSLVIENKNLEQSTILINQATTGSYTIESHKARWTKGISFLVFDKAGNYQSFPFEIKR